MFRTREARSSVRPAQSSKDHHREQRFPACRRLSGTGHHLIVFGEAPRLDHLRARWDKLVSIVDAASAHFDATEAGVPNGGAILVRPDGFIGFRAAPADETTMDALDAHLTTYLVPLRRCGLRPRSFAVHQVRTCLIEPLSLKLLHPEILAPQLAQDALIADQVAGADGDEIGFGRLQKAPRSLSSWRCCGRRAAWSSTA